MNPALAFKAEILLAVHLVTRHRAPRLVLLLVASLLFVVTGGGPDGEDLSTRQHTLLLISGAMGAVFGSRLLARGGALGSARTVATSSLVPAVGRLAGSLVLTGPLLLIVSMAVIPAGAMVPRSFLAAVLLAAVTTCGTMALAPVIGASSAAALGFGAALFGGVPPSAVGTLLSGWPPLRTAAVLAWNALPLSWRLLRWLRTGPQFGDPWILLAWLVAVVWLAALAVERSVERGAAEQSA